MDTSKIDLTERDPNEINRHIKVNMSVSPNPDAKRELFCFFILRIHNFQTYLILQMYLKIIKYQLNTSVSFCDIAQKYKKNLVSMETV